MIINPFTAFLERDRQFPHEYFFKTHSGSRKTLLWVFNNFPKVKIEIYESSKENDKLRLRKLIFTNRDYMLEYINNLQKMPENLELEVIP